MYIYENIWNKVLPSYGSHLSHKMAYFLYLNLSHIVQVNILATAEKIDEFHNYNWCPVIKL